MSEEVKQETEELFDQSQYLNSSIKQEEKNLATAAIQNDMNLNNSKASAAKLNDLNDELDYEDEENQNKLPITFSNRSSSKLSTTKAVSGAGGGDESDSEIKSDQQNDSDRLEDDLDDDLDDGEVVCQN